MTSLADICLPVVIENDYWRVQRRLLQSLPEEICDAILAGLLRRGCVDFVSLGLFAHSCSAVHLSGRDIGGDARAWLRTLSHFSGLQTLHIEGADRLQEDALAMLAPLAATLQELSLQGCHALRDRAGQHLQALAGLTQLDIGGLRPVLQHMRQHGDWYCTYRAIEALIIKLQGTQIPSGRVAGLRSLAVLSMHQGLIRGNSDDSFSQLGNLDALDVSDTDMGNEELQQLQALSQLRSLNLTWTKVTRPPLVSSLTSLEMGNVEVAPTPEDLDWLEDNGLLIHLESLHMPGASLSQQGEAFVRTLLQCSASHLTSLDVRQVTASSADFLEGLPQHNALHTLNISGCQGLHDLHLLRGMTDLRDLDLSQTDVSDSGLFRIAAMSQLTRLSLRDTAVTAVALKALADLSSLQSLDLSHTSIHNRIHQNLGAPAALCPRTLLAVGTKLSDRDVHALMSFAGRRLQNLHLGTSIIESIYCLRTAVGLERLVLAGCNCITEEQLKSVAGLFRSLHSLTIHHCFLLTEHLAVDVDAWAPESLASLSIDDTPYYIERRNGARREAVMTASPTKQPKPARRMSMEELQAYDERLRYSREELQSIAAGLQRNGAASAALSQAVRSLDLAPAK